MAAQPAAALRHGRRRRLRELPAARPPSAPRGRASGDHLWGHIIRIVRSGSCFVAPQASAGPGRRDGPPLHQSEGAAGLKVGSDRRASPAGPARSCAAPPARLRLRGTERRRATGWIRPEHAGQRDHESPPCDSSRGLLYAPVQSLPCPPRGYPPARPARLRPLPLATLHTRSLSRRTSQPMAAACPLSITLRSPGRSSDGARRNGGGVALRAARAWRRILRIAPPDPQRDPDRTLDDRLDVESASIRSSDCTHVPRDLHARPAAVTAAIWATLAVAMAARAGDERGESAAQKADRARGQK